MKNQFKISQILLTLGVVILASLILLFGVPIYKVWQQEMTGKAELSRAEQNRQIRIQEAKAKKEAAVFEAEAEVERAKGVAQANKIIGESLNENENYLRYLWIQSLNDGNAETIYVPTEANLPILEADRFSQPKKKGSEK
ncbi:MAG: membrane protease subunit [Porphyromonadaceae bacterium]|nr:membrane protease subunit [Porphyromonadaceae bacterium]